MAGDTPAASDPTDGAVDEPIRVLVRVRPPLPHDGSAGACPLQVLNGDTVTLTRRDKAVSVRFDAVLEGR